MTNVEVSVKGTILTLTVDLSQSHGLSTSGKTTIIASTQGNHALGNGVQVGLNVFRK